MAASALPDEAFVPGFTSESSGCVLVATKGYYPYRRDLIEENDSERVHARMCFIWGVCYVVVKFESTQPKTKFTKVFDWGCGHFPRVGWVNILGGEVTFRAVQEGTLCTVVLKEKMAKCTVTGRVPLCYDGKGPQYVVHSPFAPIVGYLPLFFTPATSSVGWCAPATPRMGRGCARRLGVVEEEWIFYDAGHAGYIWGAFRSDAFEGKFRFVMDGVEQTGCSIVGSGESHDVYGKRTALFMTGGKQGNFTVLTLHQVCGVGLVPYQSSSEVKVTVSGVYQKS